MENNEINSHFEAANNYIAKKKYELAYRELRNGLVLEPTSYHGHLWLGYVAGKLRRDEEWAKENKYLLNGYGRFEASDGSGEFTLRPDIARPSPAFSDVFRLLHGLASAEFRLGRKSNHLHLFRQSLLHFKQVLAYDPDFTWTAAMCAWCHIELEEYDLAEKLLQTEIALHPRLSILYLVSARLNYRRRRLLPAALMTAKGFFALLEDFDFNVKSQRSRFHFPTEAEARRYFERSPAHSSES